MRPRRRPSRRSAPATSRRRTTKRWSPVSVRTHIFGQLNDELEHPALRRQGGVGAQPRVSRPQHGRAPGASHAGAGAGGDPRRRPQPARRGPRVGAHRRHGGARRSRRGRLAQPRPGQAARDARLPTRDAHGDIRPGARRSTTASRASPADSCSRPARADAGGGTGGAGGTGAGARPERARAGEGRAHEHRPRSAGQHGRGARRAPTAASPCSTRRRARCWRSRGSPTRRPSPRAPPSRSSPRPERSRPASSSPPTSSRSRSSNSRHRAARSPTPTTSSAAAASRPASPTRATRSSPRWAPSSAARSSSRPPSSTASTRRRPSSTRRRPRSSTHRRARSPRTSRRASRRASRRSARGRSWRRRWRWPSVSQTVANGGVRLPNAIARDPELQPPDDPVKVSSPETAATMRQLMIGVVNDGTGIAAQLPGDPGRRQDRHRRAGPERPGARPGAGAGRGAAAGHRRLVHGLRPRQQAQDRRRGDGRQRGRGRRHGGGTDRAPGHGLLLRRLVARGQPSGKPIVAPMITSAEPAIAMTPAAVSAGSETLGDRKAGDGEQRARRRRAATSPRRAGCARARSARRRPRSPRGR